MIVFNLDYDARGWRLVVSCLLFYQLGVAKHHNALVIIRAVNMHISHNRDPNLQFVEQPALQPPEFVINQADQQVSCRYAPALYFFFNIHVTPALFCFPLNQGSLFFSAVRSLHHAVVVMTDNVFFSKGIHPLSTARGTPECSSPELSLPLRLSSLFIPT